MADIKDIDFTKDPLSNIKLMFPLLNEESKKMLSCLMCGFYICESAGKNKKEAGHNVQSV